LSDFYHSLPMLAGRIQSRARGSGDDLYAIRRYQTSDHQRNIDWKATAKAQEMMVREHSREDEWRLSIVFDTATPPELAAAKRREAPAVDRPAKHQDPPPAAGGAAEAHQRPAQAVLEKFERANVPAPTPAKQ